MNRAHTDAPGKPGLNFILDGYTVRFVEYSNGQYGDLFKFTYLVFFTNALTLYLNVGIRTVPIGKTPISGAHNVFDKNKLIGYCHSPGAGEQRGNT